MPPCIKCVVVEVIRAKQQKVQFWDKLLVAAQNTIGGTNTGMMGTFDYAAPEQFNSPQNADERADLYSAAKTGLFILFGDDIPFLDFIRNPDGFVESLPISRELAAVFLKAVEWEPEHRYQRVSEFRKDLLNPPKLAKPKRKNGNKKKKSKGATAKKRFGLPKLNSPSKVVKAFATFDKTFRHQGRWSNFENNRNYTYAIRNNGLLYPVKKIIELATGRPVASFSGGAGQPNELIQSLGFEVVNMRDGSLATETIETEKRERDDRVSEESLSALFNLPHDVRSGDEALLEALSNRDVNAVYSSDSELMERVVLLLHKAGVFTLADLSAVYTENKALVSELAELWAEWEQLEDSLVTELNFRYGEDGQPDLQHEIRKINAGTMLYLLCQILLVTQLSESDFEAEFGDFEADRIQHWYFNRSEENN